jgi:hypothetical protein
MHGGQGACQSLLLPCLQLLQWAVLAHQATFCSFFSHFAQTIVHGRQADEYLRKPG